MSEDKSKAVDEKALLQSYQVVKVALDTAARGQFPLGLDAIEYHAQVRASLKALGVGLASLVSRKPCGCDDKAAAPQDAAGANQAPQGGIEIAAGKADHLVTAGKEA